MNADFRVSCDTTIVAPIQDPARSVRRILVIDDDRDIRQLCADVLIRSGYRTDTAADGEAGWKALNAVSYDLLITDNNMPNLSGLELVRQLRAARMALAVILASGQLPAVILASVTSETPVKQSPWNRSLQIAAILPKPFTIDELLRTVKAVLSTADRDDGHIKPMSQWSESMRPTPTR
jgi:DNA-binding response OmpR family regulator